MRFVLAINPRFPARGMRTVAASISAGLLSVAAPAPAVAATADTAGPADTAITADTAAFIARELSATGTNLMPSVVDTPDVGLSIDAVFALDALGGQQAQADATYDAIKQEADAFIHEGGETDAGRLAKIVALRASRNDVDASLLQELVAAVGADGALRGVGATDTVYNFSQAWAVIALSRSGETTAAGQAAQFLLNQRCESGAIPLSAATPPNCAQENTDTTALFVQAVSLTHPEDPHLQSATQFLRAKQGMDGGLASEQLPVNANTTGLAAGAFAVTRDQEGFHRAHSYLSSLRFDASAPASLKGAFAWSRSQTSAPSGPTDQIRRASVQAAVGFAGANYANANKVDLPQDVPTTAAPSTSEQPAPSPANESGSSGGGFAIIVAGIIGLLIALGLGSGGLARLLGTL